MSEHKIKTPIVGPKSRKSAETFTGALALILGWLVGDVMGYEMPDHVLQSFTIVFMIIAARFSEPDKTQ